MEAFFDIMEIHHDISLKVSRNIRQRHFGTVGTPGGNKMFSESSSGGPEMSKLFFLLFRGVTIGAKCFLKPYRGVTKSANYFFASFGRSRNEQITFFLPSGFSESKKSFRELFSGVPDSTKVCRDCRREKLQRFRKPPEVYKGTLSVNLLMKTIKISGPVDSSLFYSSLN